MVKVSTFSALFWLAPAAFNPAWAAPQDGRVTSGQGVISQDGKTTTIVQSTNRLSINWQSFGIAADETVQFRQPSASAIALNRVIGNDPSKIYGQLNANGRVYLINPNGILFGQDALVNVGALVASTFGVNDASLNGSSRTFSGTGTGSIVNQGTINATGSDGSGGYVALLGNAVSNQGVITAPLGKSRSMPSSLPLATKFSSGPLMKLQAGKCSLPMGQPREPS